VCHRHTNDVDFTSSLFVEARDRERIRVRGRASGFDADARSDGATEERRLIAMSSSFAKKLADGDEHTRDKTFIALAKWLASRESLDAGDAKKLWKGLFYSFWRADGRRTQLECANKLGALVHGVNRRVMMTYYEGFLWTMRREWAGIDHHRMDKYCLLTKRATHHALRFAGEREWDGELVDAFANALRASVFGGADDKSVNVGFKMYLSEVFLQQIEAVTRGESGVAMDEGEEDADGGSPTPMPSAVLAKLVAPFMEAMQKEESEVLLKRITSEVFEPLADASRAETGAPRLTPSAMKGVYDRAIALGAEVGVDDVCREALYELHALMKKGAMKIKKDAEARGVDPELDVVIKPTKTLSAPNVGAAKSAAESDKSKEKKNKKKKSKRDRASPSSDVDVDAARREKKRRKKEKRLAKEMAALAAETAEAEARSRSESSGQKVSSTKGESLSSAHESGAKMIAMRAIAGREAVRGSPLAADGSPSASPSKRLMWNDDGITFSTPDSRSPINTQRGKRNLKMTPTKTLLRPIHAAKTTPTSALASASKIHRSPTSGRASSSKSSPARASASGHF